MDLAAICFASCVVLGALFYSSTIIYSNASMDQPPLAYSPGLRLSPINLFIGPQCKWRTPIHDVPKNIEFHKTVVAGFPSEENNVIRLLEALTGFGEFYLYIFYAPLYVGCVLANADFSSFSFIFYFPMYRIKE